MTVNILAIAGSDPSGGAGIQADLKSIAAAGGYGMAAITALTAQNTQGVTGIHTPPTSFLAEQLEAVSNDVRIDAVKIGMLADADVVNAVADWLRRVDPPLVVIDPVMIATSGDSLLDSAALAALRDLLPLADLITPNLPELAVIAGTEEASGWEEALEQAKRVAAQIGVRVLVKGGHLHSDSAPDALVTPEGEATVFDGARIDTPHTHGTGCSLSSGVATRAARFGGDWKRAVTETRAWLRESIGAADTLTVGGGHGPVHHFAGMWDRAGLETTPTPEAIAEDWWQRVAPIRQDTDELGFIQRLALGTLDRADFLDYIAQDSIYLLAYARVLARVSAMAPTPEEQAFWAQGAEGAILGELALHEARLGGSIPDTAPSFVTTGYVNHLLAAATRDYEEAAAAVLPCYWVYTDLGARLRDGSFGEYALDPAHPYAEWLGTYDDPEFAAASRTAVAYVTQAASRADEETRQRMWRAFETATIWEREFFAQTAAG